MKVYASTVSGLGLSGRCMGLSTVSKVISTRTGRITIWRITIRSIAILFTSLATKPHEPLSRVWGWGHGVKGCAAPGDRKARQ